MLIIYGISLANIQKLKNLAIDVINIDTIKSKNQNLYGYLLVNKNNIIEFVKLLGTNITSVFIWLEDPQKCIEYQEVKFLGHKYK